MKEVLKWQFIVMHVVRQMKRGKSVMRQVNEALAKYDIPQSNIYFEYESGSKEDRQLGTNF